MQEGAAMPEGGVSGRDQKFRIRGRGGGVVVQNGWTGSRRREELRGQRLGQGEEEARKQSGQELRVHRIFSCQKKSVQS